MNSDWHILVVAQYLPPHTSQVTVKSVIRDSLRVPHLPLERTSGDRLKICFSFHYSDVRDNFVQIFEKKRYTIKAWQSFAV